VIHTNVIEVIESPHVNQVLSTNIETHDYTYVQCNYRCIYKVKSQCSILESVVTWHLISFLSILSLLSLRSSHLLPHPPPPPWQQIAHQLEYRLIQRRLATGAIGWTTWLQEDDEHSAGSEEGLQDSDSHCLPEEPPSDLHPLSLAIAVASNLKEEQSVSPTVPCRAEVSHTEVKGQMFHLVIGAGLTTGNSGGGAKGSTRKNSRHWQAKECSAEMVIFSLFQALSPFQLLPPFV
jgi:hypothetical protein